MIFNYTVSLIIAALSLQDIFKEFREYEEYREYQPLNIIAVKKEPVREPPPIIEPITEKEIPAFFSEDMVAIQANREKLIDFIRSFPKNDYSVVETADAYLYIKENKLFQESQEVENLLKQHVHEGSTVIDYGAENGTRTLTLSNLVGRQGKVVAFESRPLLFREMYWNLALNKASNVQLYCTVLSEKEETLKSLNLENISLIRINADGRENIFFKVAKDHIEKFRPVLILSMIGGIPPGRADQFVRQEFQKRIDDIHKMGYTTRRINTGEYLALPNYTEHR